MLVLPVASEAQESRVRTHVCAKHLEQFALDGSTIVPPCAGFINLTEEANNEEQCFDIAQRWAKENASAGLDGFRRGQLPVVQN